MNVDFYPTNVKCFGCPQWGWGGVKATVAHMDKRRRSDLAETVDVIN